MKILAPSLIGTPTLRKAGKVLHNRDICCVLENKLGCKRFFPTRRYKGKGPEFIPNELFSPFVRCI